MRALTGREGLSDDELKRALVRWLLVQQLGEGIGNDPAFEKIVSEVLRILSDSEAGRVLLDRAVRQLGVG